MTGSMSAAQMREALDALIADLIVPEGQGCQFLLVRGGRKRPCRQRAVSLVSLGCVNEHMYPGLRACAACLAMARERLAMCETCHHTGRQEYVRLESERELEGTR